MIKQIPFLIDKLFYRHHLNSNRQKTGIPRMLTKLKERIQSVLAAEAETVHRIGLTPNMLSGIGLVLAFLSALAYTTWRVTPFYLLLAAVLFLFSGFCDALDGIVARLCDKTTNFGGFLDSLLDRYADVVVYSGIIIGGLCDLIWGLAAIIGSFLVSYSRARAEAAGVEMESIGIAERAERMIILALASAVATFWRPQMVMNAGIFLLAVLSNLTVLQRSLHVYKKLKRQ
ncbi:CDP-alcohol phosphatidyltransferase family protein [Candidatus Bathyarchaeota archaeon]|nr:CDP-alcohol phosphatidyltransferase family protein [Candidatus Bathyarchaeota archaeon]